MQISLKKNNTRFRVSIVHEANELSFLDQLVGHPIKLKQPRDLTETEKIAAETTIAIIDIVNKYKDQWEKRISIPAVDVLIEATVKFTSLLDVLFYDTDPLSRIATLLDGYDPYPLLLTVEKSTNTRKSDSSNVIDHSRLQSLIQTMGQVFLSMSKQQTSERC